jgi:hypothetical protein
VTSDREYAEHINISIFSQLISFSRTIASSGIPGMTNEQSMSLHIPGMPNNAMVLEKLINWENMLMLMWYVN